MTIAAGFLYDKGLFLCADTQFTGTMRLHGSKILCYEYDDGSKGVYVTVGHMRYARMCVQLVSDSIEALPNADRSLSKMYQVLVQGIREIHQGHLFKLPARLEADVQLIVGFWSAQDKALGFYSTESSSVIRLYGYDCLGSGEMLAHYLIRPKYQRPSGIKDTSKQTLAVVKRIALTALAAVKTADPNCGGETRWVTLTSQGVLSRVQSSGK